ncbi:MAG: metallophosphoesterase, partial [Bacteroidetes bacterium]|nr:metallophosphoesterase [Bacteroidota bacterium]
YDKSNLTISFPRLEIRHDLYYRIDPTSRSIEIVFNEALDSTSVSGNITLSDHTGFLEGNYDVDISGAVVWLLFHPDFHLKDGWLYELTLTNEIRSVSGKNLRSTETIELRTTLIPFGLPGVYPGDTLPSNSIAVISDIHMGDARATAGDYCWFGKNKDAMEDFLSLIKTGGAIKQLVIQGDLFDEWIVPFDVKPFDPNAGINNSFDYFKAIAESQTNKVIFDKLRAIASDPEIDFIYIPGNHDMMLTQKVLDSIIPGIIWKGDVAGLGKYNPIPEIIMEHGHRYDFFNCPQPLVNPGHILPPGYFISRLDAYGMALNPGIVNKSGKALEEGLKFETAWTLAMGYLIYEFSIPPFPMDTTNVLMTGIDGYTEPFSFNGARDMYADNIEDLWISTQLANDVPVPLSVLAAMWNSIDLTTAAVLEYMQQSPHLANYKIVSFGHSHNPMLEVFPYQQDFTNIYANSGSWIDADQCTHDVRTFLIVTPGEWTGSQLDIVRLYQYNLDSNSGQPGAGYSPVLKGEESIRR